MFYAFAPANETLAFLATLGIASVMFIVISAAFLAVLAAVGAVRLLIVGGHAVCRTARSLPGRVMLLTVNVIRPSRGKFCEADVRGQMPSCRRLPVPDSFRYRFPSARRGG